jgi:hypothetical protein
MQINSTLHLIVSRFYLLLEYHIHKADLRVLYLCISLQESITELKPEGKLQNDHGRCTIARLLLNFFNGTSYEECLLNQLVTSF